MSHKNELFIKSLLLCYFQTCAKEAIFFCVECVTEGKSLR
ncbi:Uncharacterised protein [Serratia liquefaciens]|jgi:hypothetical protein|nr:Uncharacterised protein [Serratia liquefaciens]CAI0786386.1 Uncharacterised protein [Serratia liquefaciens]CAI0796471.1 Uncharacterised protein [Serratia liquefaciens]CAI0798724.1 Uncharacterised protein [Serratia liquefaciens]CAI0887802.1 Uncharacterised protein [Serratia liquefaciens]